MSPNGDAARPPGSLRGRAGHERERAELERFDTRSLVRELTARVRDPDLATRLDRPEGADVSLTKLLGILHAELGPRVQGPQNRFSLTKSVQILGQLRKHPDFDPSVLHGATCVDAGCGGLNPLGRVFVLLLAGAERGIGVDMDSVDSVPVAVRALYQLAANGMAGVIDPLRGSATDIASRLRGFDLRKLARGDESGIASDRLSYRQSPFEASGIEPGTVDILFSHSFLEHVPDPKTMIAAMASTLRSGGLAFHAIDGRDHRIYTTPGHDPLEFLRDSSDAPLVAGCNRVRPVEFAELFESAGLEVRATEIGGRTELSDDDIGRFAPRFRSKPREALEVLAVAYHLRRR